LIVNFRSFIRASPTKVRACRTSVKVFLQLPFELVRGGRKRRANPALLKVGSVLRETVRNAQKITLTQ
jgi:hypothetical protein